MFDGIDARAFLQGQLSQDLTRLAPDAPLLAGYHSPQGRVIAVLRVALGETADELLAVLPLELIETVRLRLSKYVLRSRLRIADASDAWRVLAVPHDGVATPLRLPLTTSRALLLERVSAAATTDAPASPGAVAAWTAADITDGLPQVYAATSERYVSQMLNLDVLGGIAFDKGCYTGQEVIARAHYRGRVKRRMQRFRMAGPRTLSAGDTVSLGDGLSLGVVAATTDANSRSEFLAVAVHAAGESFAWPAEVEALTLPYALPD